MSVVTDFELRPSERFDFDIERDEAWPMPQAIEWPEPSRWQKFKARCAEIFAAWGEPNVDL